MDSLLEASFQKGPVVRRHHSGDYVEGEDVLLALLLFLRVEGECDAHLEEVFLGGLLPVYELPVGEAFYPVGEKAGPLVAVLVVLEDLVVEFLGVVALEVHFSSASSLLPGQHKITEKTGFWQKGIERC